MAEENSWCWVWHRGQF